MLFHKIDNCWMLMPWILLFHKCAGIVQLLWGNDLSTFHSYLEKLGWLHSKSAWIGWKNVLQETGFRRKKCFLAFWKSTVFKPNRAWPQRIEVCEKMPKSFLSGRPSNISRLFSIFDSICLKHLLCRTTKHVGRPEGVSHKVSWFDQAPSGYPLN